MSTGNMYHRIKFYPKTTTRDSYGASVDTYTNWTIETRGEIRYTGGSKDLVNDEKFYSKGMELTIRYRPGVDETMYVQVDGTDSRYEILYIEELGRNNKLRLSLEKINA